MSEKKISTKLLLKSGFWYTVSNFLTRGMVFITMPIFTRLMTKDEYGNFSVYASWQVILLAICGIEIYGTINRARFDFTEKRELDAYITSSLVLSTVFTGVVFLLYLLFPDIFDRIFLLERKYMLLMFAYLFTYPAFSVFQAKQCIEYRYKFSAAISFALTIGASLLAVILVLSVRLDRLLGRIVGQYILYCMAGVIFYIYFIHCSRSVAFSYWKYALRMGLPLVFSCLGSQVLLTLDSLVLKHMCSAELVSYLSVTHSCSHIMLLLVQALNTAWSPWFYDMLKLADNNKIRKVFQIYLWAVVACTFAVLLIGPEIILVLGGAKYRESLYILPPVILCGVFTALIPQFVNLEIYYKKPEYAAILTGIAAVLNIFLDIGGVKLWGYRAVCYTTVFCQLLLIGLHYCATRKMHVRELFPMKNVALVLCIALLLIPGALSLYQSDLARGLCIIAAGLVVIITVLFKRKAFMVFIGKSKRGSY